MTGSNVRDPETKEAKRTRWDWILLPLISLGAILLLGGTTEWIARRLFSESKQGVHNCIVLNDSSTGARGIPNSVCWEKSMENPPVEYRLNSCGHRAGMECGPKPPGVFRIVMIGSSFAMGERVQREKTFAALLPAELAHLSGRKVELYNESMGWGFTHSVSLRFNAVLAAEPDLILWVVTPGDIARAPVVLPTADLDPWSSLSLPAKAWQRLKVAVATQSIGAGLSDIFGRTRTSVLLRHYIYKYEIPSRYLATYFKGGDEITGSLKAEPSAHWRNLLLQADSDAADMEGRARTAGIPFAAVLVPDKPQATMISVGQWPMGYDPFKLDEELHAIIVSHGGTYLDILPGFRNIINPEMYYFPVDGHPNEDGHAMLSILLSKQLTGGAVPALRSDRPQAALAQGR
jgi:hypothetical protein